LEISGKKVLVTGGAGFIGSHLVDSLLRLGGDITVFDNFDDFYKGKEQNIETHLGNPRFHLVKGTILDYDALRLAMQGSELVFHLAAQPGIRYCLTNPLKAHEANATGTLNVLLASKKLGVGKLVYASSSSLYGNVTRVPILESHPLNPTSIYGATKLAAEKYCLAYHEAYGLPVTCLRYFSVYGPRGRPDQVLYSMAEKAAAGEAPVVYGDGKQSRDFTFVSDIISGTILAALRDDSVGQVFNLGFGAEFSIAEAAERINDYFRNRQEPVHKPAISGDFFRTLCDNQKARHQLGWSPKVGFTTGLDQFLGWFSKARIQVTGQQEPSA
jgi:UDP-glucose 4-epimerase